MILNFHLVKLEVSIDGDEAQGCQKDLGVNVFG